MAYPPRASYIPQNHWPFPAASSTAINTRSYTFDVFINHRGPDTKKGFASHLYNRLVLHGIRVFLDRQIMEVGENLTSQIVGAIQTASVQVAIFSPGYVESTWCLKELVLMLESMKLGATIIPVFYGVKPDHLRGTKTQDTKYANDLRILQNKEDAGRLRYDIDTIEKWRETLSEVASISGFDLQTLNEEEAELVEKIVERVSISVRKPRFSVPKYKCGLVEKVKDFEEKVLSRQQQTGKPQVHGIVGVGGIGKTTLAEEVFQKMSPSYLKTCFFPVSQNARRTSLKKLFGVVFKRLTRSDLQIDNVDRVQKLFRDCEPSLEMIKQYPSLVVLDGVDDADQWEALLPIQEVLHSNSLILITTRDRDVLTRSGVKKDSIYELNGLNRHLSQKLFCFHAFGSVAPPQGYDYLVDEFLTVCDGLPLLLKVLGAFFYGKHDRYYWEVQLDRFLEILPHDIEKKIRFSYDALNTEEQHLFLDIACVLIGEETDLAISYWKGIGWKGLLGFQSLMEKHLVEVDSENCIDMHDRLKDLGKTIAEETRLQRPLWPKIANNANSLQDSPVIEKLRRNIEDLLQQSSVIKEVRLFMLIIIIMMIIRIMMMIWSMPRRH